ncbi:MAG: Fic family protein [Candidatus Marinimicrobia bacterium]|nr:Fic family protein [Candidatus Neomarinimicrobiota bacterium]
MEPYVPNTLPFEDLDYKRLISLVGEANAELARYDGKLGSIVNPAILLSPLTTQEAVLSSRIEGTQASLDEVLEHEAGQLSTDPDKTHDIQEILNYRRVLRLASDTLKDRPLSLGLLQQMHKILMDSVRGQTKTPGEFRKNQNWIGPRGCSIEEATFVPPTPMRLLDHLQNWEAYTQGEDIDVLIQAAVIHAQFEVIHPFRDGNGRIGRLLIPLHLYCKHALSSPMFYLSEYLEANRDEYYRRLQGISQNNQWNEWIIYFLGAVAQQAKRNTEKVVTILTLYEEMKKRIRALTHSQYSIQLLDAIFYRPIFRTNEFIERSGIPKPTGLRMLRQLKEHATLETIREGAGSRPPILLFPELLNIVEGRDVF